MHAARRRVGDDLHTLGDRRNLLFQTTRQSSAVHLADEQPTAKLYDEGVAFFDRLLNTSYRYLKAGNLPYEEVKEGLAAFQEKMASVRNP